MTPETAVDENLLLVWRRQLIRYILRGVFFFIIPAMLAASYYAVTTDDLNLIPIYAVLTAFVGVVAFWSRIPYRLQIFILLILLYYGVWLNFTTEGRGALGRVFLLSFIFIAAIFFGRKGGLAAIAVALLTMAGFGYAFVSGRITDYNEISSVSAAGWISNSLFVVALGVMFVLSLHYVLARFEQTLRQNREALDRLRRIQDKLEQEVSERTHNLERARREAETARRALEEKVWLMTGQAQINEAARGEQSATALANNIVRTICRYLEAPAGILFLAEEGWLVLAGGYAYPPNQRESWRLGEGLAGQAAQTGRPITLHPVADQLLPAISGLGGRQPDYVTAVPFHYDGRLLGVVELAHWQPLTPNQSEYLDNAVESAAVAFHTAQARARINDLLAEVAAQNEYSASGRTG
jgi:hypothetical protein